MKDQIEKLCKELKNATREWIEGVIEDMDSDHYKVRDLIFGDDPEKKFWLEVQSAVQDGLY
jgi:hypothetical protein